jgi:protein tyrosine/serine phosphatase
MHCEVLSRRARTAVAFAFVLSAAAPSVAQVAVRPAVPTLTIPNFGRINDAYYRGSQPKAHDYIDLAKLGVKTVIDLTKNGDTTESTSVQNQGMKFIRIPMTTTERPAGEAVERFLKIVNDPANQPVYVHCQGGRHRTGVMTALYRLTHDGWTADRAFDEMRQYEFEKGFGHSALKSFLFDFYRALVARPNPAS